MTAAAALMPSPAQRGVDHQSDARARLFEMIYRLSFGRKDVVLSSGKPSTFYFDMKPSMLDPMAACLIADLVLQEVRAVGGEYIGGLEMGAVPITGAVLVRSQQEGYPLRGFFVRKARKEHGAKKLVEGLSEGTSLKGRRVVVFDDVTTTGSSALQAVEACRAEGAETVLAVSIVDRGDGAEELFRSVSLPFKPLFRAAEFLSR